MTVVKISERKTVEVAWDTDKVKGFKADIKAEHGSDVSTRDDLVNDGKANLTFPAKYSGSAKVTVRGSKGGEDEGVIEV